VLPFANLSGDPGQDYLVDALTNEVTTSLVRIPGSFVIARDTAMTFKGKPVDAKSGPNNSTRPAPICCRCRIRSSLVWRGRWTFKSPRPRPHV
jgi:hypothetical protein